MKLNPVRILAATGVVALATVGTAAQARDNVYWSLGVQAAPGVSLGVGNVRPVYVAPAPVIVAPVYVAPAPVHVAPAPVYYGYGPAPVYYSSGYYVRPGKHKGWHDKHGQHGHWN
jgi:hypothetical protein